MLKFYTRRLSTSALALVCCGTLFSGSVYGMDKIQDDQIQINKAPTKREATREKLLSLGEEAFTNVIQSKELSEEYITNFMFNPFNEDMCPQAKQEFLEVILMKAIGIVTKAVDIAEQKKTKAAFNVIPLYHVLDAFFLENDTTLKNETALKRTSLGTWSTKYFEQMKNAFEIYAKEMKISVRKRETLLKSLQTAYDQEGVKLGYFSMLPTVLRKYINAYVPRKLRVNKLFEREINSLISFVEIKDNATKEQILKFMESRTNLKKLYAGGCRIEDESIQYLSEALKTNTSLNVLTMIYTQIGDEGMKCLSDALKINTRIKEVDLTENGIDDKGAEYLSESLKENKSIKVLKLWGHNITDKGMEYLSDALKINTSIQILELSANGDKGTKYLSDALKVNKNIKELYAGGCRIEDEGIQYLSEALTINQSIKLLSLKTYNFSDNGMKYLSESLKNNTTLTSLKLSDNNLSEEIKTQLKDMFPNVTHLEF